MPEPPQVSYHGTSDHMQQWFQDGDYFREDGPALTFFPRSGRAMSLGWFDQGRCMRDVYWNNVDGPLNYDVWND